MFYLQRETQKHIKVENNTDYISYEEGSVRAQHLGFCTTRCIGVILYLTAINRYHFWRNMSLPCCFEKIFFCLCSFGRRSMTGLKNVTWVENKKINKYKLNMFFNVCHALLSREKESESVCLSVCV